MTKGLKLNRRVAMQSLLAVATASLVACGETKDAETPVETKAPAKSWGKFLNANEMALLTTVAGLIIPQTDTPGAVEAGVPDTIQELLSGWGADDVRDHWRAGLTSVSDYFQTVEGGGDFKALSAEQQVVLLGALDTGVYKNEIEMPFYKDLKSTIATAYYMSEPGATEELEYDPVPGDFKGCIDFSEVGKAWAT